MVILLRRVEFHENAVAGGVGQKLQCELGGVQHFLVMTARTLGTIFDLAAKIDHPLIEIVCCWRDSVIFISGYANRLKVVLNDTRYECYGLIKDRRFPG